MADWGVRLSKLAQFLAAGGTVPDTAISTAETDTSLRLAPDGAGGVEWGTGGSGVPTVSFLGYNTVGGTTEGNTANRWYFKQVTAPANGIIMNVGVYMQGSTEGGQLRYVSHIWADSGGTPREVLSYGAPEITSIILLDAVNGAGGLNARWLRQAHNLDVVNGGVYWIGCSFLGSTTNTVNLFKDGSGTDKFGPIVTGVIGDAGWAALTTSTDRYSMRALFMATS